MDNEQTTPVKTPEPEKMLYPHEFPEWYKQMAHEEWAKYGQG